MKKICYIGFIVTILILIRFVAVFGLNELMISNYHKGKYQTKWIDILYVLNLQQSYIDYYNHGNLLYQQGEFEQAIQKYETALTKNPPQKRVCDIRINLALSMLKIADEGNKLQLRKAREVLYEDNCAEENGNGGQSQEAEQLEEEIKELEEESGQEDPNGGGDEPEQPETPPNTTEIEEEIRRQQKQNTQNRNQYFKEREELQNWSYYNGKKW